MTDTAGLSAREYLFRRSYSRIRQHRPATITDFIEQLEDALGQPD